MQTREDMYELLKRFADNMPHKVMTKMEKTNIGIGMVLRCLEEVGSPVSAGEISRYMNVSTARVAVLLRTMSDKGLIVKDSDSFDARKISVSLSEKGREVNRQTTEELIEIMSEIVEKVGSENFELFLSVAGEIKSIVSARMAKQCSSLGK